MSFQIVEETCSQIDDQSELNDFQDSQDIAYGIDEIPPHNQLDEKYGVDARKMHSKAKKQKKNKEDLSEKIPDEKKSVFVFPSPVKIEKNDNNKLETSNNPIQEKEFVPEIEEITYQRKESLQIVQTEIAKAIQTYKNVGRGVYKLGKSKLVYQRADDLAIVIR